MTTSVEDSSERARYEVTVDGALAGFAAYRDRPGDIRVFTHTEIDGAYEGRGLGGLLVSTALDDVRSRGLTIRPLCPFVRGYLERHPEYADLVDPGYRAPDA